MPSTFTAEQDFPYPWQLGARAVWNKYPNPYAEHVVSVDVIEQSFDPISAQLRTERILGVRQGAPKWMVRLFGASEDTYVREVVMLDPVNRTVQMSSTNLSLSEYMLVKEYITYTSRKADSLAAPLPPSQDSTTAQDALRKFHEVTEFKQVADISCTGLTGIFSSAARKVEDWSYSRFNDNAAKGRNGLSCVLQAMYKEQQQ